MSRPRWARVTAVVAATLAGGALVAFLVVPRGSSSDDPVAAGLVAPPAVSSTAPPATPPPTPPATPTAGGSSSEAALPSLTASPATVGGQQAAEPPTRVAVTRLGIDMTVEPQGVLPDGQMALPATPDIVGWYRFGSAPDDAAGATVLAAHVDSKSGIGPFVRLNQARAGDEVDVWVGSRRHTYRVTKVVRVEKTQLDGDGLFAVTGPRVLHLVTCSGAYLPGTGYTDNLVVIADPVVT
jgi:LPXTG-site transpeptidase (sortase) family protein